MKFLKYLLIVVFLSLSLFLVPVAIVSYGTGVITSGDNTVTFEVEEPITLNEWFYNLTLSEKIEIYNQYNK